MAKPKGTKSESLVWTIKLQNEKEKTDLRESIPAGYNMQTLGYAVYKAWMAKKIKLPKQAEVSEALATALNDESVSNAINDEHLLAALKDPKLRAAVLKAAKGT